MTIAANPPGLSDIAPGRLDEASIKANFADLHPPLTQHEARVEAERCYFCFDAPCQKACPTSIDIPLFIRQIAAGNRDGAAKTIFDANIMGGTCARVCPTETLCEEACVREVAEGKPVTIGLLQRYATDPMIEAGKSPFARGAPTGERVAVVGSGPAGLACAHALAVAGVEATIFEARQKAGGLNEYGIAAYKMVDGFAAKEAAFILSIGGIEVRYGSSLGKDIKLDDLRRDYDAVFLAIGLDATNKLGLPGEGELENVVDAVDYIARLRQAEDLTKLPVGRRVVVIGGGMTAIDIAVQTKRLGAESVTMVYRRGVEKMKASQFERELAQTSGVVLRTSARPVSLEGHGGALSGVLFEDTREHESELASPGSVFRIEADMLFTAIGQRGTPEALDGAQIDMKDGRIVVDAERRTSLEGVWAGGDCVLGGEDLTVSAVQDGKQAARSIIAALGVAPSHSCEKVSAATGRPGRAGG
jgi:glutamate synthase (NADPH/NADH) small chain